MTTDNPARSVLLIGKSQLVLDDSVAGLRELGYKAEATNDFANIAGRFDARNLDLIVLGGQVPPDRKAELREETSAPSTRRSPLSKDSPASQASSSTRYRARSHPTTRTQPEHRPTRPASGRYG